MPTSSTRRRAAVALVLAAVASPAFAFKDIGPTDAKCDAAPKGSPAWTACLGSATAGRSDAELFYAGYWLARTGHYEEALGYLRQAKAPDEKVLTYIGFATRKLGHMDEAFRFYARALEMNPGYSVARAYRGEGYLALNEPDKARAELAEIARRSGTASAEYGDLADNISRWEKGLPPKA